MRFDQIRIPLIGLVTGWVTVALAAPGPETLSSLPWAQIAIGGVLALWGGLTRTAERALGAVKAEREYMANPATAPRPAELFLLVPELLKDVLVSSGVGFLVFAAGARWTWDVWVLGPALWSAGYLGTRFLTRYTGAWLDKKYEAMSKRGDL